MLKYPIVTRQFEDMIPHHLALVRELTLINR